MGRSDLVLYVEDDDANFLLVKQALADVSVIRASDGLEGLQKAQEMQPALILADLHLPKLEGLELVRRLKGDSKTAAIPVIALTANVLAREREQAIQAGCCDYLTKPFSIKTLRRVVERILGEGQ